MLRLSRRDFALAASATLAACAPDTRTQPARWPASWDRILIEKFVAIEDHLYDDKQHLLTRLLGPGYRHHTKQRERRVHPTRESLDYALGLLELGGDARRARAQAVVSRVLDLQDADPKSPWFGLWGWYSEEPPSQMAPADDDWAGFIGATLLLIDFRHAATLPDHLRQRIRHAIHHAAVSIMRRDVPMTYTSSAAMGAFVTLAAAELLNDADLRAYASGRIARFAQTIDVTGSFDEYNSPHFARVALTNLARIRAYVKDAHARQLAARIEERLWLHLASHWDAPRLQFAGPMSRCYSTDLGSPAWLEKALDGRLHLLDRDKSNQPLLPGDIETAIHDVRCPTSVAPLFLSPQIPRQHRELFVNAPTPVQGVTWLDRRFSLGSVNRGDFWNQRRPILAYFGDASRPARSITVRVIKDGYDFASAQLFSIQERNCLLAVVNFRSPGGDRHISLDPIKDGRFQCGRLFVEFDFEGLPSHSSATLDNGRFTLASSALHACIHLRDGRFGRFAPRPRLTLAANSATFTIDFLPEGGPHQVAWNDIRDAWLAFTIVLSDTPLPPTANDNVSIQPDPDDGSVSLAWQSPAGALALTAATRVQPEDALIAAFRSTLNDAPIPNSRLSSNTLAD